jgi:hypothetical protein
MAQDNTQGLGTMLAFLGQNADAGNMPMAQASIPQLNMPQGGPPPLPERSHVLGGILGNLASSYLGNKLNKYQEKQDAKDVGESLSMGIKAHAETLPKDSPIRRALNTIGGMPHTPVGVEIMQKAYQKFNDTLAQNEQITSDEKNLNNSAVVQRQDLVRAEGKIPSGYMKTDTSGAIAPMNLPGGITYQDLQTQRMQAAKATPGWGQPEHLNLAIENSDRDERRLNQQAQEQARRDSINSIKEKQAGLKQSQIDWRLSHPTYNNDMKEIQQSEADHARLVASIGNYKKVLAKYPTQISRHNPLANAELQNAYQSVTWPARSKNMSNTGVMNVGEFPMIAQIVTNPSELSTAGFRSNEELNKQLDSFIEVSKTGHDTLIKARMPDSPPPTGNISDSPSNPADIKYEYRINPETGKQQRKRIN